MKNKIEDLRNHVFETIELLLDEDSTMDVSKARAIASLAQVVVNSAKIEVDFIKATSVNRSTGFFPKEQLQIEP